MSSCWRVCAVRVPTSFFFNDTATTEIYPLSLHDALPISFFKITKDKFLVHDGKFFFFKKTDRKSTRLNSSHMSISYAVFCLKEKVTAGIAPQMAIPRAQMCFKSQQKCRRLR